MVSQVANTKPASRPSIHELKLKYESQTCQIPKHESSALQKSFNVKQMASMFNNKISQSIGQNVNVNRYNHLPSAPKPIPQTTLGKPVPLPRTRFIKETTPVPRPRSKAVAKIPFKPICFIDEDVIDKLTVKDKALLYTQFVDDMTRKNPKITKHAEAMESTLTKEVARGEVVNEKQVSVKRLLEELEARCVFPKQNITPIDIQGLNSPDKSQEFEDILNFEESEDKQKSIINKLLEETTPKKEALQIKQKEEYLPKEKQFDILYDNQIKTKPLELVRPIDSTPKATPQEKKLDPVLSQHPAISHTFSPKNYGGESGISILPQNTSYETQHEYRKNSKPDALKYFTLAKPLKPMCKKKISRTIACKINSSLLGSNSISISDSESEIENPKHTVNKPIASEYKTEADDIKSVPSFVDLDKGVRVVDTPRTSVRNRLENNTLDCNLYDASYDQGFETGPNDAHSPTRPAGKSSFINLRSDPLQTFIDKVQHIPETSPNFSTPIKSHGQHNLSSAFNESGFGKQLFSPISMPISVRPCPIYDNEPRRTSKAMQINREDHEMQSSQNTHVPCSNAPTIDMAPDVASPNNQNTSSFWIKTGDFSIAFDIDKIDLERARLLCEIFSHYTKVIHFGIDGHKFSVSSLSHGEENISKHLPLNKETSQYWFSTGEWTMPFSGKLLNSQKIERIFQFMKASVEETGVLRFGVDEMEFSNMPKLSTHSTESNCNMIVGLQTDSNNDCEKYRRHSKPVPVNDLDHYGSILEKALAQSSISPIGCNLVDLSSSESVKLKIQPNSGPKSFCNTYDNEPLDQLFDDTLYHEPAILNAAESSVKERLSCYNSSVICSFDALDALKGTPEYLIQLKSIVSDISHIGCSNDFKYSSLEELERYMLFLSCYADICLTGCSSHMDKILDVILGNRDVSV